MTTVDWPRLLGDLQYLLGEPTQAIGVEVQEYTAMRPATLSHLAAYLGRYRTTVTGWQNGQEPKHRDGEELIERWCTLTGKSRVYVPRT